MSSRKAAPAFNRAHLRRYARATLLGLMCDVDAPKLRRAADLLDDMSNHHRAVADYLRRCADTITLSDEVFRQEDMQGNR